MPIQCLECGFIFENEDRGKPCPKCGSHNRSVTVNEEGTFHELLELRKKGVSSSKRKHKFDQEIKTGEKIGKDGKLISLERVIDRERDVYKETVKDEQAQIIVKKQEKLSEHR